MRFIDDSFTESFMSTLGVDFKFKQVDVMDKKAKLQIWDTAGQERFHTITKSFYRGSHGIALVFDICDYHSFAHCKGINLA